MVFVDETTYQQLAGKTFRAIDDALASVDPDVVEVTFAGDVLTLAFANGLRCIVNTQRPVQQIWLAAKDSAWHFSWDAARGAWLDDKGRGVELHAQLEAIIRQQTGQEVPIPAG